MKKYLFLILSLPVGLVSYAQGGTNPQPKPKPKPVAAKPVANPAEPKKLVLKNLNDSASYAIGISVASFYQQQGLTKLNSNIVAAAMNDVLGGKPPVFDEFTANAVMNQLLFKLQEEKSKPIIEAGQKFLAENKTKPGVKTTASGLQYEVIREGTGIKPAVADTFVAHYRGTLLDGTEFDASYNRNQPLVYGVSQVIPGWTEGLQLMSVGSKYKFYIPYNLGYGMHGSPPAIPGGAMLIFELELLDVKKKQ